MLSKEVRAYRKAEPQMADKGRISVTHLGIIMDGNRRWARSQGLPSLEGHQAGLETLKRVARTVFARGIKYLSVYAFSTENWNRSSQEVNYLLRMLLRVLSQEIAAFHRAGVQVKVLGSRARLAPEIIQAIEAAETKTAGNVQGTLVICLNYGGQTEIADAVVKMIAAGVKAEEVTPERIAQFLYAPDIPPLDLIIRTSGEQRLSNFMLWRAAYSEFYFSPKMWPEFDEAELDRALAVYGDRQRRFGA